MTFFSSLKLPLMSQGVARGIEKAQEEIRTKQSAEIDKILADFAQKIQESPLKTKYRLVVYGWDVDAKKELVQNFQARGFLVDSGSYEIYISCPQEPALEVEVEDMRFNQFSARKVAEHSHRINQIHKQIEFLNRSFVLQAQDPRKELFQERLDPNFLEVDRVILVQYYADHGYVAQFSEEGIAVSKKASQVVFNQLQPTSYPPVHPAIFKELRSCNADSQELLSFLALIGSTVAKDPDQVRAKYDISIPENLSREDVAQAELIMAADGFRCSELAQRTLSIQYVGSGRSLPLYAWIGLEEFRARRDSITYLTSRIENLQQQLMVEGVATVFSPHNKGRDPKLDAQILEHFARKGYFVLKQEHYYEPEEGYTDWNLVASLSPIPKRG